MRQEARQDESGKQRKTTRTFEGFPNLQSNVCFTPNQFFDVVLPHSSRGVVRLVAYIVRMTLGWCDREGKPRDDVYVSWSELVQNAGIARGAVKTALDEAIAARFIECLTLGAPHCVGQPGSTALYRLRWDSTGDYVTDPERFDGFYEANANFTYIPNAFYDALVPNEKLSVIRVVGAIVRNTICWQVGRGHRRQHVSMSLSELERRTRMHRETASVGLQEALAAGYLRRDQEGVFDHDPSLQRPATYSLRWEGEAPTPDAGKGLQEGSVQKSDQGGRKEDSENPTSPSVQKSDQPSVQKSDQEAFKNPTSERFKNPTSIEITDLNNITKQQQGPEDVVGGDASLRASVLGDLVNPGLGGFTRAAALKLIERHPLERIRAVLDSVSLEGARVKPAFVTAAVKDGRYTAASAAEPVPESAFAKGFYDGRSEGGSTVATPSPSDVRSAIPIVRALAGRKADGDPAAWGAAFGRYVRGKDAGPRKIATLALALKAHGDDWVGGLGIEDRRTRAGRVEKARQSHEEALQGDYRRYLTQERSRLEESNPEAFTAFECEIAEAVERIARSPIRSERAKAMALADLNSEGGRFERLAGFMTGRGLALAFWEWDRRMNPRKFMEESQ